MANPLVSYKNLPDFTVSTNIKATTVTSNTVSSSKNITTDLSTTSFTENIPRSFGATPISINVTALDTTQQYGLGTKYEANGNTYRYCQVAVNPWPAGGGGIQPVTFQAHNLVGAYGGTNLAVLGITLTTMTVGSYTATVVAPANVTTNQYQNWYFYNENGGYGEDNVVVSHPAASTGQPLVLTLSYPNTQSGGTGPIGLVQNPWIIAPYNLDQAATQLPVGVILIDMFTGAPTYLTGFVWVQTKGYCSVKQSANVGGNVSLLVAGNAVVPASGGNTDTNVGRVCGSLEAAAQKQPPQIGICVVAPPAYDQMAFVNLDLE